MVGFRDGIPAVRTLDVELVSPGEELATKFSLGTCRIHLRRLIVIIAVIWSPSTGDSASLFGRARPGCACSLVCIAGHAAQRWFAGVEGTGART